MTTEWTLPEEHDVDPETDEQAREIATRHGVPPRDDAPDAPGLHVVPDPEDDPEYEEARRKRREQKKPTPTTGTPARSGLDIPDLAAYFRGEVEPVIPTIGMAFHDHAFLYPGCTHEVISAPAGGKTWFMLGHSIAVMKRGGHVVYIDLENNPRSIVARLRSCGVAEETGLEQFHYVRMHDRLTDADKTYLIGHARDAQLVVIDGVTPFFRIHGKDPNVAVDASWFTGFMDQFASLGPAVAVADHPNRQGVTASEFSNGSFYKSGGITGASFQLQKVAPMGKGNRGVSELYVSKDREGEIERYAEMVGNKYRLGQLIVDATADGEVFLSIDAAPSNGDPDRHEERMPLALMERVSEVMLEAKEPLNTRRLRALVGGNSSKVDEAVEWLIIRNNIVTDKVSNAKMHTLVRPFSAAAEEMCDIAPATGPGTPPSGRVRVQGLRGSDTDTVKNEVLGGVPDDSPDRVQSVSAVSGHASTTSGEEVNKNSALDRVRVQTPKEPDTDTLPEIEISGLAELLHLPMPYTGEGFPEHCWSPAKHPCRRHPDEALMCNSSLLPAPLCPQCLREYIAAGTAPEAPVEPPEVVPAAALPPPPEPVVESAVVEDVEEPKRSWARRMPPATAAPAPEDSSTPTPVTTASKGKAGRPRNLERDEKIRKLHTAAMEQYGANLRINGSPGVTAVLNEIAAKVGVHRDTVRNVLKQSA